MDQSYQQKNWWLIRHAPVLTDKIYGQMDVSADFSNSARIEEIAKNLPDGATYYSSDLQRCVQTAARLLSGHSEPQSSIEQFTQLREQSFGAWEGLSYSEIEKNDAKAYESFWQDPVGNTPGDGESFMTMSKRVTILLEKWITEDAERNVVVSAHAGPIRVMIGYALGLTPQKMLALSVAPLSVTRLISFTRDADTIWRIECINDQGSLRKQ
ncbi:histidine phosphatase family protein [Sneathiella marina]|uniref:Histidine phosphatase family protein n=1 Tax=Sneathiella marina TaxID=2950108 RepID=A0ABY4W542_9PROT|nr:histidine phosphatase family protein [Sneathiella marina]USG60835.1 histidine phosphatase family protein [Sneathiella marina]